MSTKIQSEWRWELVEAQTNHWQREYLIWKGIFLASVEGSGDRWFGNFGDGRVIEAWGERVAHKKSRAEAKQSIERILIETLTKALQDATARI